MKKNPQIIWPSETSEFWNLTKGRKAEVIKIYFRNGEHHVKGKWLDTNEVFESRYIFFRDTEPIIEKPDLSKYPKGTEAILSFDKSEWIIVKLYKI